MFYKQGFFLGLGLDVLLVQISNRIAIVVKTNKIILLCHLCYKLLLLLSRANLPESWLF